MKKITLLFTLLCASALNGMETSSKNDHYVGIGIKELSPEIQVMIIQALNNTYDKTLSSEENLTNTINAIKAMSRTSQQLNAVVNNEYGTQKGFTNLVHILANKFKTEVAQVAEKFRSLTAKTYIELGDNLLEHTDNGKFAEGDFLDAIAQLIQQGADVNFEHRYWNPLGKGIMHKNIKTVKLLLDAGAVPTMAHLDDTQSLIEFFKRQLPWEQETLRDLEAIKQLLEEAIKKQQKETL